MVRKFFTDETLTAFVNKIKAYVNNTVSTKANEYSLRYEEFISLNTYMIQKLYNKIESLENEIKLLKKG